MKLSAKPEPSGAKTALDREFAKKAKRREEGIEQWLQDRKDAGLED